MNRIVEIVAMTVGGLSLFLVAFVGFVSLSGRDVSEVAVLGKLFAAPTGGGEGPVAGEEHATEADHAPQDLSDAAVVEASLGDVLTVILDDGPVRGGTPSTVVDCSSFAGGVPRILREGAISATDIANALG